MDDHQETPQGGPVEPRGRGQIYHTVTGPPRQISSGKLNEIIHRVRLLSPHVRRHFSIAPVSPGLGLGEWVAGVGGRGGRLVRMGEIRGTWVCTRALVKGEWALVRATPRRPNLSEKQARVTL